MLKSSNFESSELNDRGFPRLKRKVYEHRWVIAICVLAFFVFELPRWNGGSNFGDAAWICSMSIAVIVEVFWESRRKLWFPITVSLIVAVHVVVFCCIHWTKQHYFGAVYREVGMVDGLVVYFVMWFARGVAGDGWQDKPNPHGKVETEQRLDLISA